MAKSKDWMVTNANIYIENDVQVFLKKKGSIIFFKTLGWRVGGLTAARILDKWVGGRPISTYREKLSTFFNDFFYSLLKYKGSVHNT